MAFFYTRGLIQKEEFEKRPVLVIIFLSLKKTITVLSKILSLNHVQYMETFPTLQYTSKETKKGLVHGKKAI